MKRREFISDSCLACLSIGVAAMFSACSSTKYVSGRLNRDELLVEQDDFKIEANGRSSYRPYIIIRNDDLKFPICVYRFREDDYSALWMQCAHQGAEVQVAGSHLQCPAHGSEYDNRGRVTNGPAETGLRTFPVTVVNNQLFIDLRRK